MATNDTDLLITETGMFGTFSWELSEDIKGQLRGIKERLPGEDGEGMVRLIKQDVSRTVQLLLLYVSAALVAGGAGDAMMQAIRVKMLEAVDDAKRPAQS